MRAAMIAFSLLFAGVASLAGGTTVLAQSHDMIAGSDQVKWGAAPPSLPKGAQIAVLAGDPSKDVPFVIRLKLPANYVVPAHQHPTAENVTVLSGTFNAGMGDKVDKKKTQALKSGGFVSLPAKTNHYAWTSGETVVQVNGTAPFVINYVNSADDPSKG
jgi:quercetin dioxygenase-like cupin family protein